MAGLSRVYNDNIEVKPEGLRRVWADSLWLSASSGLLCNTAVNLRDFCKGVRYVG